MRINNKSNDRIQANNKELNEIEAFCYLGSAIYKSGYIKDYINIYFRIAGSTLKSLIHLDSKKDVLNKED